MPRKKTFGTRVRVQFQRNNGKFGKCNASPAEQPATPGNRSEPPLRAVVMKPTCIKADRCLRPNCHCQDNDNWEADDSWCYFCHSNINCEVDPHTHYTLCASCCTSDPTQGWWDNTEEVGSGTEDVRFDPLVGLGLQYMANLQEDASLILMKNGSRMKPAKRGSQKVSVDNHYGHFKYEPKGVRNRVDSERKRVERKRKSMGCLQDAAKTIPMQKITALFAKQHTIQKVTLYRSSIVC